MDTDQKKSRAKEVAQAVLSGRIGMLDACRELARLGDTPGIMSEEIHIVFLGSHSETDHLPLGAVRDLWDHRCCWRKTGRLPKWKLTGETESSLPAGTFWTSILEHDLSFKRKHASVYVRGAIVLVTSPITLIDLDGLADPP